MLLTRLLSLFVPSLFHTHLRVPRIFFLSSLMSELAARVLKRSLKEERWFVIFTTYLYHSCSARSLLSTSRRPVPRHRVPLACSLRRAGAAGTRVSKPRRSRQTPLRHDFNLIVAGALFY